MNKETRDYIKSRLFDLETMDFEQYQKDFIKRIPHAYFPIRRDSIETLNSYVLNGTTPGSFILAVLCNDLWLTFSKADDDNLKRVFATIYYVHNCLPRESWGSESAVKNWIENYHKK